MTRSLQQIAHRNHNLQFINHKILLSVSPVEFSAGTGSRSGADQEDIQAPSSTVPPEAPAPSSSRSSSEASGQIEAPSTAAATMPSSSQRAYKATGKRVAPPVEQAPVLFAPLSFTSLSPGEILRYRTDFVITNTYAFTYSSIVCFTAVQTLVSSFGPDEFDEAKVFEMLNNEATAAIKDPSLLNDYLVAQLNLIDQAERQNRTSGMTRKEEKERDKAKVQNPPADLQIPGAIDDYAMDMDTLPNDLENFLNNIWEQSQGGAPGQPAAAVVESSGPGERDEQLNTPVRRNDDDDW